MIDQTKEWFIDVAQDIEIGWRVFVHKTTGEKFLLPSEEHLMMTGDDSFEEDIKLYEKNENDYLEFEKWESREEFEMMEEFAENFVTDRQIRAQLITALANPKPFKNFKFIIDNTGETRQEWFDFKSKWQADFVEKQYEAMRRLEK